MIRKLCLTAAVACGAACFATPATCGECCRMWLDPAVRHTNGMLIASSQPHRNSSVSWTCNPDKLGYCGGHYYRPCWDSIRCQELKNAAHGYYPSVQPRYQAYAGSTFPQGERLSSMDGIEPTGMTDLGQLPSDAVLPGPLRPALPPIGSGR